jgi:hypothetical protein
MNCQYCDREIKNYPSLKAHEQTCVNNPNRIRRKRSPNAGAQKGSTPWNAGKQTGRSKYWDEKFPLEEVLVENSSYSRVCVRRRILDNDLIEYRCACCGIGPEWHGKPMPLILDHINGMNNDHRLENLRFVCSNCDSQLDTYKSKNKGGASRLATAPLLKSVER